MRIVSLITSLVTLIGFASSAGASATIDLIWSGGGSNTTLATSSSAVLNIVLTNDVLNIGASVSVDYSAAAGELVVVGLFNNPNGGTSPFLPLTLGPTSDFGGTVESFNAAALPPTSGPDSQGARVTCSERSHFTKRQVAVAVPITFLRFWA